MISRFKIWVVVAASCCFLSSLISGDRIRHAAERSGNGSVVGFNVRFPNDAGPGHASFLLGKTTAHDYTTNDVSLIDGKPANRLTWASMSEPAWMLLLGTALIGIARYARRRRNHWRKRIAQTRHPSSDGKALR